MQQQQQAIKTPRFDSPRQLQEVATFQGVLDTYVRHFLAVYTWNSAGTQQRQGFHGRKVSVSRGKFPPYFKMVLIF
jgi:hypothetical protein